MQFLYDMGDNELTKKYEDMFSVCIEIRRCHEIYRFCIPAGTMAGEDI